MATGPRPRLICVFALDKEAAKFADRLTRLLNGTVTMGGVLEVTMADDNLALITTPGGIKRSVLPLSLDAEAAVRAQAPLWLRIEFRVAPDDERKHLRVNRSLVGLCVNPQTGHCAMRVEYDRNYETAPAAHLNIAGESTMLGYAFAAAGTAPKPLEKVHFPNGGKRFRPSVEDFIEFLAQEGLVSALHVGWQSVLAQSRDEWMHRQTRAATRRQPEAAAEQLRAMGYQVEDPQ